MHSCSTIHHQTPGPSGTFFSFFHVWELRKQSVYSLWNLFNSRQFIFQNFWWRWREKMLHTHFPISYWPANLLLWNIIDLLISKLCPIFLFSKPKLLGKIVFEAQNLDVPLDKLDNCHQFKNWQSDIIGNGLQKRQCRQICNLWWWSLVCKNRGTTLALNKHQLFKLE